MAQLDLRAARLYFSRYFLKEGRKRAIRAALFPTLAFASTSNPPCPFVGLMIPCI
jgi:hypothetical protein